MDIHMIRTKTRKMAEPTLIISGIPQTLDIPRSAVKKTAGFSIDFGSSAIKIVYALPVAETIRLHFVSYARDRIDEAFQYIYDHVGNYMHAGEEVYITGVGGNQHRDKIEEKLDIKINLCMEMERHAAGFLFLTKHCPLKKLLHPPSKAVQSYAWPAARGVVEALRTFSTVAEHIPMQSNQITRETPEDNPPQSIEFPALLFMIGSDVAPMFIYEDGSHEMFDLTPVGGRCLLGSASLIAQTKSFEELVTLAERGDSNKLNQTMEDVLDDSKDDTYSQSMNAMSNQDTPVFSLGQAAGCDRDDFSREDRAAAVISLAAHNIAVYCQMWSMFFKAKHVYFIGGLHSSSQLLRDEIGKQFAYRTLISYSGIYTEHHFVKLGAYLGALGCLVKNLGLL